MSNEQNLKPVRSKEEARERREKKLLDLRYGRPKGDR